MVNDTNGIGTEVLAQKLRPIATWKVVNVETVDWKRKCLATQVVG